MRKSSRLIMSILLVVAMIMQLATVGFAAVSTASIGAISYTYDAETGVYTASVSTRGLEKGAMLIIAEYKADGTVNADVSETAENAKENVLTVSISNVNEENEVKVFLWDEDYSPFTMDTVIDGEYSVDDIEIYLDGVDFATAIGEELELDAEYEYVLALEDTGIKVPHITFDFKDSTIDADVVTDAEAMQTVITFKAGEREEVANQIVNNATSDSKKYKATRYEYSKPWVHTVTINYIMPATGYITNEMTETRSNVNGLYGGGSDVKYDYVMEYTLPEGKEYDTISFKADSYTSQYTIIVVEPLEAATKGTDAVVNADGTPINWLTDTGVIEDYDYTLEGTDRTYEPWDEARATYGQYARDTSIVVKGATSDGGTQTTFTGGGTHYRLARRLQESDGYFVSGARIAEGSRDPSWQKVQYTEVPDSLKGYNYITNSGGAQYDLTVSMTVNQNVRLHFISTGTDNGVSTLNSDGEVNKAITATNLGNDDFRREYQNTAVYDALSCAYHIVNSGLEESILIRTSNATWSVELDGITYNYPSDVYVFRNWAMARKIISSNAYGKYISPEYFETAGIGTTVSGSTVTVAAKTIGEYVSLWRELKGMEPLVSTPAVITGHIYNGSNVTYADSLKPVIREFNGASTNKSIFSDRAGAQQQRHTGMIVSYPEVFDLEDSAFITTAVKYGDGGEGDKTMYRMYGNLDNVADYEPYPLYTFTVSKDCEVLIFSNGYPHAYLNNAANGWSASTLDEGIRYIHVSNEVAVDAAESASVVHLNKLYRKTFFAGDTVTIYTPGNTSTVFVPFIKEINVEHTPDAADIKVDGVTIDGFNKDVSEYIYNINNITAEYLPTVEVTPADSTAEVEIVYNKTYEAPSAKIYISTADGKESVYTIKFENGQGEVTNLYLCTEGNIIPAEYLAEGTTEAYTAKFPASYLKAAFGLDMVIWADRQYKVTEVLDESLIGKDVIRSQVAWWNAASNPEYAAYKTNAANGKFIPWINFKTTRAATVMVFKTSNANDAVFKSYGFNREDNSNGYFKIVRDGNAVNISKYKYFQNVEAGELITVPNDNESSNSYTIIIKYADYK